MKGDIDFVARTKCDEDFRSLNNAQLNEGIIESQVCAGDSKDEGRVDACQVIIFLSKILLRSGASEIENSHYL